MSISSTCLRGDPDTRGRDAFIELSMGKFDIALVAKDAACAQVSDEDRDSCLTKGSRQARIVALTDQNLRALRRGDTTRCLEDFYRRFFPS